MAINSGTTYRFTNAQFPAKALNVYASGTTISARRNVCLYTNDTTDVMQQWVVTGNETDGYILKCKANQNYALRYSDGTDTGSYAHNADVKNTISAYPSNHMVKFEYLGNNRVRIKHTATGKYLTAWFDGTVDTNTITQDNYFANGNVFWMDLYYEDAEHTTTTDKQVWNISPYIDNSLTTNIVANTAYTFQNAYSSKMLNLYGGNTTNSTNVCMYYFDASTEQKWTPKSSGSYLKLYTESGSGKCLHKASTGNAEIYSDSSTQNSNQQIVIEPCHNQGYVKIRLASSDTMYLTASYDAANGGNTTAYKNPGATGNVFWATASDANVKSEMQQRWYARLASRANDDVVTCRQSKNQWCWATVAREMIRYKNGSLKDIPYCADSLRDVGVRTSAETCPTINGVKMADNATAQLVCDIKGSAVNEVGTHEDIIELVKNYTNIEPEFFGYDNDEDISSNDNISRYVDSKLANGPVVLNAFQSDGQKGHSVLIINKTNSGLYNMWDPYPGIFQEMTAAQLFKSEGFRCDAISGSPTVYGCVVVFFDH